MLRHYVYVCMHVGQLFIPGHEACPGVWLIYLITIHWRKLIFSLSQWVSIPNSFLVKSGTSCLLPLLTAGPENAVTVSVSSDVHQSCAVWGHPPTSLLKSFCHHHPWYRSLSLEGRGLIKILHLGMSASKLLTLGILSGVNFFWWLPSIASNFSDEGWVVLCSMVVAMCD